MATVCIRVPAFNSIYGGIMLNKIIEIREAIGQDKTRVMRKYPGLKRMLRYTYDPFKKYYITTPELNGITGGSYLLDESFNLLDDLSSRELSGQAAFEAICDHIATLNIDSAKIFKMVINKDLRSGTNIQAVEI